MPMSMCTTSVLLPLHGHACTQVCLYSVEEGTQLYRFASPRHQNEPVVVRSVHLSRNSRRLVVGGELHGKGIVQL